MNKRTVLLAVGLFAALVVASLLAGFLPSGEEDIAFEYQLFLKEVLFDADGHAVSLSCTMFNDPDSPVMVSLERVKRAVTPSGKTSFKKLRPGDLLFVSVDPEGGVRETYPPVVVADVIMVKSLGAPTDQP